MGKYVITCCSTVDLTQYHMIRYGVEWVPFHYEIDGVEHDDDMWGTRNPVDFYEAMNRGAQTKTSRVNVLEFQEFFERFLRLGLDVLHVSFSSGLSGTVESARIAAQTLSVAYPERRITVIDSLCASSGYGLLVDKMSTLMNKGMDYDNLVKYAEANKLRVHHWFFSTDLSFYVRGGRISKTAAVVGSVLKICPLLNMSNEGKLAPKEKIRTKKRALAATLQRMVDYAEDGLAYSGKAFICHSVCDEDAEQLARMVEGCFPNLDGKVEIFPIGPTIGSHTGPGTVALFFWGDPRAD